MIDIPSPCVGICSLEPGTGLCTGCLRTGQEIAAWPFAGDSERLAILAELRARRRARGRTSAADSRPRRRAQASGARAASPAPATARAPRPLGDLLARRPVLLADGAMGTSLFAMGLVAGDAPELWNVEHPESIASVHRGFVEAGADVVLTNSFGANRLRLALHDAAHRVDELNRAAAAIARDVAEDAGRTVLVAGSMGPTGELFEPVGTLDAAAGAAAFAEQAEALAAGGADLLWIETISAAGELEAAFAGAARTGLPIVATMSFDTAGRTMMGVSPEMAMALRDRLAVRPAAFGANCGTGPAELVLTVLGLGRAAAPADVLVAKGNCGIPHYVDGRVAYDGTPEIMADYARLARDAGARIIGGCCGTTPDHVAAMAAALRAGSSGPAPDRATIERLLGPVAEPAAQGRAGDGERRTRRRRA